MKFKHITLALLLAGTSVFAQIKSNQDLTTSINSNAFIDASENVSNFGNNIGRGLLFPPTDLSTFKLDKAAADGINYPTYFDGMILYNTKEGGSTTDPNIQSTDDLSVGYYYFSNPEGVKTQSIAKGKWVKISDAQATANLYTQNGTLTENRTVNLDNKILAFNNGQIGINTEKPKATLDIQSKDGINNGILIPRVTSAQRDAYDKPERGLMVYNTDKKCYETNSGTAIEPKWTCLAVADDTQTLKIEPLGIEGNFRYATANNPNINKVKFKVTNNTGSALTGLDLSFVKVDGDTQYVAPGQNDNVSIPAYGSVILTYGISGGNWGWGSRFTLQYDQYSKASITVSYGKNRDNNGIGTGNGGTATFYNTEKKVFMVKQTVNGVSIDKSVTISSTSPFKIQIPFKDGIRNYLKYESDPIDVVDANGDTRQLKLSYPAGNLSAGTGVIEAVITSADGTPVTLKQTTLGEEEVVASIPLKLNGKDQGTFDIIAFGGIKDKHFDDPDGKHRFVYMPVVTATGRTWLNNNLGAEYSRVGAEEFNPEQQAKTMSDPYAYGSMFQFRRGADGHELTVIEDGRAVNKTPFEYRLAESFQPSETNIIYYDPKSREPLYTNRRYDWVDFSNPKDDKNTFKKLWTLNGANNPCPEGYYVPTPKDWSAEFNYLPKQNNIGFFEYMKAFENVALDDTRYYEGNYSLILANPSTVGISGGGSMFASRMVRCIKAE